MNNTKQKLNSMSDDWRRHWVRNWWQKKLLRVLEQMEANIHPDYRNYGDDGKIITIFDNFSTYSHLEGLLKLIIDQHPKRETRDLKSRLRKIAVLATKQ